ncbi:hypothetical protein [Luteimonas sp. e5]
MVTRSLIFVALVAFSLVACDRQETVAPQPVQSAAASSSSASEPHTAETNSADVHAHATELPPVPQQPWATDAPLRQGMDAIAEAVTRAQDARTNGAFDADQAAALAREIETQFHFMLANCKLEPEADVALHALLAQIVAASQAVKKNPGNTSDFDAMTHVLMEYPRYFDHPSWRYPKSV